MANALTGDFDVVAEFAVAAVNRTLAAMHQCERFLHSISVRVDDNPPPGPKVPLPVVVGAVDGFGDAIVNHQHIGVPVIFPGSLAATDPVHSRLAVLINPDLLGAVSVSIVPSHIQGVAQIQLFPPTVIAPNAAGTNLTVRMNIMVRFFPDKNTAPLAEYIRGDLQITAPVNKIVAGRLHVLNIDFKASDANITFTPSYSSQSLSAQDLAGISLCIQNGLRTSFLPSSVTLPPSVADVQLKTLPGAIAVLLDMNDHPSTPASVNTVFLSGDDDFAFAAGRDYLLNALRPVVANILGQPPQSVTVPALGLHFSFAVTLKSAAFDLQPGSIVLTIKAHADPTNHTWVGSLDFTVTVPFSLQAVGPTVELGHGTPSLHPDSTLADVFQQIIDFFTGQVTSALNTMVDATLQTTGAGNMVSTMFDADLNLGNVLNEQLTPPDNGNSEPASQRIFLVYNSVDIRPAGIVLHGTLLLLDWPSPYVEFEQIPPNASGQLGTVANPLRQGPDYSALKSWIPGGTIGQYEWSVQGQEQAYPFLVDPNRFVLLHSGPQAVPSAAASIAALPGYTPLCLTIRGLRISSFGPVVYQPVSASVCGYMRYPVIPPGAISTHDKAIPLLAVTRPGLHGETVVSGHTPALSGDGAPNLLVHFADGKSATQLELLTGALNQSKRKDAPTGVMAVLSPDQFAKARYVPGVVYAEEQRGDWEGIFRIKTATRPLTLIVGPRGSVAWQKEGALDRAELAAALAKHLAPMAFVKVEMPRLNPRIGQPAPDFLFEYAAGQYLPLSKLKGRARVLVFWKSSVRASLEAVLDLQKSGASAAAKAPIVLAINDGEEPELARRVAAGAGITTSVVTDPKREISLAYGVSLWPTIVSLDPSGIVAGIRYGYHADEHAMPPSKAVAT